MLIAECRRPRRRYRLLTACSWLLKLPGVRSSIALVICVCIAAYLIFAPARTFCHFRTPVEQTTQQIQEIVDGYSLWTMATRLECPNGLADLERYRTSRGTKDGWQRELVMLCGDTAPRESPTGFGMLSAGPDRHFGTVDDIKSWRSN